MWLSRLKGGPKYLQKDAKKIGTGSSLIHQGLSNRFCTQFQHEPKFWWKTGWTNFGHFRILKIHCFEDLYMARGMLSNIEIDIFEDTTDLWVQLHVCKGSRPKEKGFTTIFGAKIDTIGFSNFFQYFIVNCRNRILFKFFL